MDVVLAPAVLALCIAAVHLFAGLLTDAERGGRWAVSAAGGSSVAYVFVLLLPETNTAVLDLVEESGGVGAFFRTDETVYAVVLAGFVGFYGVHALVTHHADDGQRDGTGGHAGGPGGTADVQGDGRVPTPGGSDPATSRSVFWAHVGTFAAYNALIGYLLFHQEQTGVVPLLTYAAAMGLHFLVTDAGFRRHHGERYDDSGRWVLAGAVLLGGIVGALSTIDRATLALLFAFLAGSNVFNVIKEELPAAGPDRFAAFLGGTLGYGALLLAL